MWTPRLRWSVLCLAIASGGACEGPISDLPAVPSGEAPGVSDGGSILWDGGLDGGVPDAAEPDGCTPGEDGGVDASRSDAGRADDAQVDAAHEAGCSE